MTTWCHRAVRVGLLLSAAGSVSACGATGLNWVDEPELPQRRAESVGTATHVAPSEPSVITATAEDEPAPEAHPRLSHTVTLGEIEVLPPEAAPASAAGQGVSVTINNYTTVGSSGAGYGYAGYGYAGLGYARSTSGFGNSRGVGASRSSSSGPQAGQSWPAITSYGSSFPLLAAPAPQFSRRQ
jgi:hypothetical protein